MLEKLKQLNLDRILDIEEAVSLAAYARSVQGEYEYLGMDAPEWLNKSVTTLRDEINRRNRETDLAALKNLEREIDGYKTVSERKSEAQRRAEALKRKLGLSTAKQGK